MDNTNNDKTIVSDENENYREELEAPPVEQEIEPIPEERIRSDAEDRAKKSQPIVTRIIRALKREQRDFSELVINSEPLEKRVALLTNGVLEKFEVERAGDDRMVGTIFKGKIQNLEPGLKAAFVDIGEPKNAFLHYWDILPAANDNTIEIVRDNAAADSGQDGPKITLKDIPNIYTVGKEIVVQVTKASIGTKGPRTTTNIALPGRFLVLMPFAGQCGISRKIADRKERQRLKKILNELTIPAGMGVIMRTAGENKKARYFVRDLHILLKKWERIQEKIKNNKKPCCVYREPDLIERTVRDFLTEEIDRVIIDNADDFERILGLVSEISSRSRSKINRFTDNIPIFERFNVERQIEQTFMRKVPLASGGEIVIEETEALVSIDVNTGGHKNADKDGKDFIVRVNLEAAQEVARQIRLRNMGGLIIVDFIDMKQKRDRNAVYQMMRREMAKDSAKSHVLPISQLGLLEMSRQRHKESNSRGIYTSCPYCNGRGIVKSPRSISVEIQRKLTSVIRSVRQSVGQDDPVYLRVLLHPVNLERLRNEDEALLVDMEKLYNVRLSFRADPGYHVENFKILDARNGRELR